MSHNCLPLPQSSLAHQKEILVVKQTRQIALILSAEVLVLSKTSQNVGQKFSIHMNFREVTIFDIRDLSVQNLHNWLDDDLFGVVSIIICGKVNLLGKFCENLS